MAPFDWPTAPVGNINPGPYSIVKAPAVERWAARYCVQRVNQLDRYTRAILKHRAASTIATLLRIYTA